MYKILIDDWGCRRTNVNFYLFRQAIKIKDNYILELKDKYKHKKNQINKEINKLKTFWQAAQWLSILYKITFIYYFYTNFHLFIILCKVTFIYHFYAKLHLFIIFMQIYIYLSFYIQPITLFYYFIIKFYWLNILI